MNKKYTYFLFIVLFVAGMIFIIVRYNNKEHNETAFYELLERKGPLALAPEWTTTRSIASNLNKAVVTNPKDLKSALNLTTIFIQEARITGNYAYYDLAAMKQVNNVLKLDSNNFQALTYKALIYLSQHHFADALVIASKAQSINPYNSFIYGILVDANVEMGNYDEAVKAADKMVSIRPDLRSYSRISYLREIHGDYPGAIEAMILAVQAGAPGNDGTEWTRVQLGHLYENNGDFKNAELQYKIALNNRNGYAPAIAGLGHIAIANKDFKKAINYFQEADTLVMDYTFKENLAMLYKLTGQKIKSDSLASLVIEAMSKDAVSASSNEDIGHYADRELAYAYLTVYNNEKALQHALAEYNRRPDNIDVNETIAWVYYKMKVYDKALQYLQTAIKTNSKNPVLLCRAGLIYAHAGNKELARSTLQEALKNNPNIDVDLRSESETVLKDL